MFPQNLTYVSLAEYCFGRSMGGLVYFLLIFTSIGSQVRISLLDKIRSNQHR